MNLLPQYSEDDKFTVDTISTLSGLSFEQVKGVFEFLLLIQFTQYLEGNPINIPYLGALSIEYDKDELIRGHKRAVLKTQFQDSELLKKIVGEIKDGDNDTILSILKNFVENQLLYYINEENHNGRTKRKHRGNKEPITTRGFFNTEIGEDAVD